MTVVRHFKGDEFSFVYQNRAKSAAEGIAMFLRTSGGRARVIRVGGAGHPFFAVYANDSGNPAAKRLIARLIQGAEG